MATASQIHIVPEDTGLWKVKQSKESAKKASELLQQDLKDHHVFFNKDHFHNHIVHHILSLYGTGATAESLQKGYDENTDYQRSAVQTHGRVAAELRDWSHADQYLGNEDYYPDFLLFFQEEMEKSGWEDVLNEFVFKGDARADDIFCRLFSGFLHPLIQLMFGVEWKQPAVVAEALAQACVHGTDLHGALRTAEDMANRNSESMPSIVSLLEAIHADKKLSTSGRLSDPNKIRDGVLVRAKDEMLNIAAQVKVSPDQLEEKTIEMFNAAVFTGAAAAIHPPKHPKFDFFLMHHINSAPFFLTLNAQSWVSPANKARILEYKIRMDLIQYAARGSPPLSLTRLAAYKPKAKTGDFPAPLDVVSRLHDLPDDGHAIKLARAAGICQTVSKEFGDREWMPIKGEELWMKVHHLIVDSVEGPGQMWVRGAGLEEAWKDVENDPKL